MDPARRTPLTAHEPKSRALKTSISKKSGNQSGECHNAGELSRLPDLPLDVLYEIFSLVFPMDLLHMSWANKAFRGVLTNKSSRQVWMATLNNIPEGLRPPPCPKDLTEIAYANLLYNPCCMDCGAPRGRAYWATRVRVCMSCIKDWVTVKDEVQDRAVVALSHGNLLSSNQVLQTVPTRIRSLPIQRYLFTKDLKRLVADLEATEDKAAVAQRYKDEFSAKVKFAQVLERLDKIGGVGRGALHIEARQKRIDQILERLADEGWNKMTSSHRKGYLWCITGVEGACVARPLTDNAWGKIRVRIHREMREYHQRMKSAFLARTR